jgi:hypothetical protein
MAATTISELESEVRSYVNSSGTLVLPGTALGSASMESSFKTYLPNAELVVSKVVIASTATAVVATGAGGGLFEQFIVTATFTPTSDDIAVVASGQMGAAWLLSYAFPCLATGIYNGLPLSSGGRLLLRTLEQDSGPAGLSLDCQMEITGILQGVSPFLAGLATIPFSGPISVLSQTLNGVVSQTPEFAFASDGAQGLTVGNPYRELCGKCSLCSLHVQRLECDDRAVCIHVHAECLSDSYERAYLLHQERSDDRDCGDGLQCWSAWRPHSYYL